MAEKEVPFLQGIDLFSPLAKGQRGMVCAIKAGETMLLKEIASATIIRGVFVGTIDRRTTRR
jgi:transcription termination factor Rho